MGVPQENVDVPRGEGFFPRLRLLGVQCRGTSSKDMGIGALVLLKSWGGKG